MLAMGEVVNILGISRWAEPEYGRMCKGSRRRGIGEQYIVNTCDRREDVGHAVTEVKIAFPVSHNNSTITQGHIH
jgi:hypothetical protein